MKEPNKNIFQRELKFGKAFPDKAKESFYNEFSTLLDSGVDIQRALSILIEEQTAGSRLIMILQSIQNSLIVGKSLSPPNPLNQLSISVGENSRLLPIVIDGIELFFMCL